MRRVLAAGALLATLALTGCGILDAITGADDPDVLSGSKKSAALTTVESLDSALPPPWGWVASGVGGAAITTYLAVRRKQKEAEAAA